MSAHPSLRRQAGFRPLGSFLLAPLVALVVVGGAAWWATVEVSGSDQAFVGSFGGAVTVLLTVATGVASYGLRMTDALRERTAAMDADAARLADETLPAMVKALREGQSVETALARTATPTDKAHQRMQYLLAQEIGTGERMRASAMSACASAAGRVQALATSMLADLREMEERHGEDVLGDLLKLDHSTAQAGRLADSIAVLTGARTGRRWTRPIMMESVLRGAVGRISSYQRVRVHATSDVAIAGYAAEGVMHALAELMDNAAKFSPPSEEVHVYVEEVSAGTVINIEDGGLVMSTAALSRAERAVSDEPLDLTTLSGTRLGLAVVGCLARKHGLTVSFRPSSRGGTSVVVMIPQELITQPKKSDTAATAATAPRTGRGTARPSTPTPAATEKPKAPEPPSSDAAVHGLPKRRRGQTLATASRPVGASSSAKSSRAADAGARFGAFRQASWGYGGRGKGAATSADSAGAAVTGDPAAATATSGPAHEAPAAPEAPAVNETPAAPTTAPEAPAPTPAEAPAVTSVDTPQPDTAGPDTPEHDTP